MKLLTSVVVFLALACHAAAQTGAGSIQGIIRDTSQAVIPAAEVVAEQVETGQKFETKTNETGFFLFPSLQPGPYKLRVFAPGMQAWEATMTLQTAQTAVVDATLKVAATSAQVTVAGDVSPLVTTANATLATTIEHERIEQLPLDGRSLHNLILYTIPGAEPGSATGALRVDGMREGSAEMVHDGAATADMRRGGEYGRGPGLDTVEEFRVDHNNADAKSNRPAKVIVKTRSGTNQFHGAAFETLRNNGIGLARRREDLYDKAPPMIRNEFGISGGGPLILPGIYNGTNRTFVFMAFEGYTLRQTQTHEASLPTAAMREGDFSGLIDGQGRKYTLYNPWTTRAAPTYARDTFSRTTRSR